MWCLKEFHEGLSGFFQAIFILIPLLEMHGASRVNNINDIRLVKQKKIKNLGSHRRGQDSRKYLRWRALQQYLTAFSRQLLLNSSVY